MRNLKRALSLAIASVMLLGMMVVGASANSFSDADEIVNKEAVEVTAGLGLFAGTDGKFLPKDNVTRAQMATIIVKMLYGSEINADQYKGIDKFSDTASFEGGWAEGYINLCANLGIVSGYGDGTFKPGNQVTTAEAVTMIINALDVDAGAGTWPLTVMSKAEELKLFDELSPKPGTNEALIRDQLASVVLQGLEYSPAGTTGYKVPGVNYVFTNYADALQAAISMDKDATDIEEVVGEDTLASKTFDMKTAKGIVYANQAIDTDAEYTTIGGTDYNIETGTDMIGHLVTVYYKDEYKSEKEPGTTYCIVDESEAIVVDEVPEDSKEFRALFGSKQLTADVVEIFDADYTWSDLDDNFTEYNYAAKTAAKGTYIVSESTIVAYIAPSEVVATTVTKVTTTSGKESISLTGYGALNNNEDEDVIKEYAGIAKDDVVIVEKTGNLYTVTKTNTVEGKVTKTYKTDGHFYLVVDGTTYSLFEGTNRVNNTLALPTDFDTTYKFYVTAANEVIDYVAVEGQADLSNIVYVAYVYAVSSQDNYGKDVVKINAQVIDMDGKINTYLLASYQQTDNGYEPSEESNGKSSALPAGTFGQSFTFDKADYSLDGTFKGGFYTFKKSDNSKLANLGIMVPTAVKTAYDKNNAPVYAKATSNMDGKEINSKTTNISTTDGTAYLSSSTKFVVYDGVGANLTATVTTGKMYHTFDGEAAVLLSRNSDGNKILEAVIINKNPDEVSNGEFYYADGNSFDSNTAAGADHWLYNEKGEGQKVTLDRDAKVARGFYTYSVDTEGVTTLESLSNQYTKLNETFETIYNNLLKTSSIDNYDMSNAKIIDVRSDDDIEDSEVANYKIDEAADLVALMNDDDQPVEIRVDVYADPDAKTVSLIFITRILEGAL